MEFDHIAVAGEDLQSAKAHVEDSLGVELVAGGRHALFGTHNALIGLSDGLYVEAIARDPDAPSPERPRWFDLDRFSGSPRLTNWVCRTNDITTVSAKFVRDIGTPVQVTRGDLSWLMSVPDTGRLPFDNICPALIQWQGRKHPMDVLPRCACRLQTLTVIHPQAKTLATAIGQHMIDARIRFESGAPQLVCEIETPHGLRVLA